MTHRYPSNYRPGSHWAVDEAWRIIDTLPEERLAHVERVLIAGMIAGALIKAAKRSPP